MALVVAWFMLWPDPTPVLPIHNPYCVAVPAVHWNVTAEELSVEPLAGLVGPATKKQAKVGTLARLSVSE